MKSIIIAVVTTLTMFVATFSAAAGLEDMTAAERNAFREEVRAYLLENPEVILEAVQVLDQRKAQQDAMNDEELVKANYQELAHDGYSFVGGNPDGKITIVEFSDYHCSFCKRAFPEIRALLKANPDVRFVLKEFPILGPDSTLASKAAISILINQGPEIYDVFHSNMMTYNGPINEATLKKMAERSGADPESMTTHMQDDAVTRIIAANHALGQKMRISGTPTFVVGPVMLRGFLPQAGMQQYLDEARANNR